NQGFNEKWIQDSTRAWYVIRTDGRVQPWLGGMSLGSPIATVNPVVWDDPTLLLNAKLTLSGAAQAQLTALSQANGFHFGGSYWQNALNMNLNERWFQDSSNNWFYITTDGHIFRGNGTAFAQVDAQVWDNPNLLFEAKLSAAAQSQLAGLQSQYGFHATGSF